MFQEVKEIRRVADGNSDDGVGIVRVPERDTGIYSLIDQPRLGRGMDIHPYIRRRASPRIPFELDRQTLLLICGGAALEALGSVRHGGQTLSSVVGSGSKT